MTRVALGLSLCATPAMAADLYVGSGQPHQTIGDAVVAATTGDVIRVTPGVYDEQVAVVGKDLEIRADGGPVLWRAPLGNEVLWVDQAAVTLDGIRFDGSGVRRALTATGTATLDITDCEFLGGRSSQGGAIYAHTSTVEIRRSLFRDNVANFGAFADASGGAVFSWYSTVTVSDTRFWNNDAVDVNGRGGAIAAFGGDLALARCDFEDSSTGYLGGAVAGDQTRVVVEGCSFTRSTASYGGGLGCFTTTQCDVYDSRFTENVAAIHGGAWYLWTASAEAERTLLCNNNAPLGWGGAIMADNTTVTLSNTALGGNDATVGGAVGLYFFAVLDTVNNSYAWGNVSGQGSAVYSSTSSIYTSNNDIFAHGSAVGGYAAYDTDSIQPIDYALFYDNGTFDHNGAAGGGVLLGSDPILAGGLAPDCTWADFVTGPSSPAIDGGDPLLLDPDGSRSDIGALGGPGAPVSLFDDLDGDGWDAHEDCNDSDPAIHPGAVELCSGVGVDEDCDGRFENEDDSIGDAVPTWPDGDLDGFGDYWATAVDRCADGWFVDNALDCFDNDGSIWEGPVWYADLDGDGLGDPATGVAACEAPPDTVANGTDCDDSNVNVGPPPPWYPDVDADGYGANVLPTSACTAPPATAALPGDCDDSDPAVNPMAPEVCDGVDNDCDLLLDDTDPSVDLGTQTTWYPDNDMDGFGAGVGQYGCSPPPGSVDDSQDCNDFDDAINPDADEVCDGADNDCSGFVDDDALDAQLWLTDNDGDGFGSDGAGALSCVPIAGSSTLGGDCADNDPAVHPGASEICDGIDNDCDGTTDQYAVDATLWFQDDDGDGYGVDTVDYLAECSQPAGYSDVAGDCNDNRADIWPGAAETCNQLDDDCDGLEDEGLPVQAWYPDADGDGYADPDGQPVDACGPPTGYAEEAIDCDDTNPNIFPGASEVADNQVDEDCDGLDATSEEDRTFEAETNADAGRKGAGRAGQVGCGCAAAGRSPTGWPLWAGLLLATARFRRRLNPR